MSSAKPLVLLLSLSTSSAWEEHHPDQVDKLSKQFSIMHIRKINEVSDTLARYNPQAVIMADPELALAKHRKTAVGRKLVEYVVHGGRVLMAGDWSSYITPSDANAWFAETWQLPWRNGTYSRQIVILNRHFSHPSSRQFVLPLSDSYSQKAVSLTGVANDDGLYWPLSGLVDVQQDCPVALIKIGKGYLGYIGDANSEQGSLPALMAMCGPCKEG